MLGVIGGSGIYSLSTLVETRSVEAITEYGAPSSPLVFFAQEQSKADERLCFIARHGADHSIPPHKVNYRANIQAMVDAGVERILSVNAVGSCSEDFAVGELLLPTQIIDYSYGREHTFFDKLQSFDDHIDFTLPFDSDWQQKIKHAAATQNIDLPVAGTYACTQGPRFETAAEVQRIIRDGGDVIGMTAMPEAALAKERGIAYASLSMVVNAAAGLQGDAILHGDIDAVLLSASQRVKQVILSLLTG